MLYCLYLIAKICWHTLTDYKIMYFRLASSKGNTNRSLRTRTKETAGVLQVGTKTTKRANKSSVWNEELIFRLSHRRNTNERKTGHELTCSYKIHFIFFICMEDYTLMYSFFSNMKMIKQFQFWSLNNIWNTIYIISGFKHQNTKHKGKNN